MTHTTDTTKANTELNEAIQATVRPETQRFMNGFFLGLMLPALHNLTTADDIADHLRRHLPALIAGLVNLDGDEAFYDELYDASTIEAEIQLRRSGLVKELGGRNDACGGWLLPGGVFAAQATRIGLAGSSAFNAQVDTRIAREVLRLSGLDAYVDGGLDLQEFAYRLSLVWSGLDPIFIANLEQQAA